MKRREFIATVGGVAAWPFAARAQQPTKSHKVGVLHPGESTTVNMRVAAIREGLNGPDSQRDLSFEIMRR
jgi:putative tryptophan/tyrosine transport system substrate-binding protein